MWIGVTRGLAGIKFSTSPRILGNRSTRIERLILRIKIPNISLIEKKGWKGILSRLGFNPRGLLDPVWWRKIRWIITRAATINGRAKWIEKNRLRVALSIANPPQIHCTTISPMYGMAERRFVITVAPQKDIWPHGKTYPMKAVAITIRRIITPTFQTSLRWKE